MTSRPWRVAKTNGQAAHALDSYDANRALCGFTPVDGWRFRVYVSTSIDLPPTLCPVCVRRAAK